MNILPNLWMPLVPYTFFFITLLLLALGSNKWHHWIAHERAFVRVDYCTLLSSKNRKIKIHDPFTYLSNIPVFGQRRELIVNLHVSKIFSKGSAKSNPCTSPFIWLSTGAICLKLPIIGAKLSRKMWRAPVAFRNQVKIFTYWSRKCNCFPY